MCRVHAVRSCTVGDTAIHLCSFYRSTVFVRHCRGVCARIWRAKKHASRCIDARAFRRTKCKEGFGRDSCVTHLKGAQFTRVCEQLCRYFLLLLAHSWFSFPACVVFFVCLIYYTHLIYILCCYVLTRELYCIQAAGFFSCRKFLMEQLPRKA